MNAMTDSEWIDKLGGTSQLAKLFSISLPSVSGWRVNGIPQTRKQMLAMMYPKKVPKSWALKGDKK